MEDEITINFRSSYSLVHIRSAILFAGLASKFEYPLNSSNEFFYKAYSTNSIFSSVAFLEATINEFFCDVNDNLITAQQGVLNQETINIIKRMWNLGIPRTASYSIFEKYEVALSFCHKIPFDKGGNLIDSILNLIKIRNALVHYEPEWTNITSNETISADKHFKRLKNRFSESPFLNSENAFFPGRCISFGCAKWGIDNSLKFVDQFFKKIGLENTSYHLIRAELQEQLEEYITAHSSTNNAPPVGQNCK